jgi:NAD(P)-dependent dehydrogenase (short-subunit alcohol dehydrogenase family)
MARPVCIITGASRGIGRAIALRFAQEGYDLATTARDGRSLAPLVQKIQEAGGDCLPLSLDAAARGAAEQLVNDTVARFGRVDVLVNNAGVVRPALIPEALDADVDVMLDVFVRAVFAATRAVWPVMKRQGGGTIVNISSVSAADPFPTLGIYGACKAWVNLFTKATAAEGKADSIRAFAIAPGAVDTQMLREAAPSFPSEQALRPEDVAGAVWSVCRPEFVHCSGETIFVRK